MTNSFDRANPLVGLTEKEYTDFALALVSYVALHATVDQTIYFMKLCRAYTSKIAAKAAAASRASRHLAPVLPRRRRPGPALAVRGRSRKESLSH